MSIVSTKGTFCLKPAPFGTVIIAETLFFLYNLAMTNKLVQQDKKQNITFNCIPFCVEKEVSVRDDVTHTHDFCQLTFVLGGRARIVINGHEDTICQGDVYVVSSYSSHCIQEAQNLEIVNVLFYLSDLLKKAGSLKNSEYFEALFLLQPTMSNQLTLSNKFHMEYGDFQQVEALVDRMLNEVANPRMGSDIFVDSSFLALIVTLSRAYGSSNNLKDGPYDSISRAIRHMSLHYTEELTIGELAEISFMSERQFRMHFQERYRCAPKQYLMALRLKQAVYQLCNTQLSVNEIAGQCGFSDSNYFTRVFRQRMGMAPKNYRKLYLEGALDQCPTL